MSDVISKKFVEKKLKWFETKIGSIEKRAMELNMLGHEAVRMVLNAIWAYLEDGDPMWLLRSLRTFFKTTKNRKYNKNTKNGKMRTIALQYMRSLGLANPTMEAIEKMSLVRLSIFEGMHRALLSIGDDEADIFYIYIYICIIVI